MAGVFNNVRRRLRQVASSNDNVQLKNALQVYIDDGKKKDSLKQLLEQASADIRCHLLTSVTGVTYNSWTALMTAALKGHVDVLKCLLEDLTQEQRVGLIRKQTTDGATALFMAAQEGHVDVVNCLLEGLTQKQKVEFIEKQTTEGAIALHDAALKGHVDFVRCVLQQLNQANRFSVLSVMSNLGNTPFHIAVDKRNKTMVLIMILSISSTEYQKILMDTPSNDGTKMADVFPDVVPIITAFSTIQLDSLYTDIATHRECLNENRETQRTVDGLKTENERLRRELADEERKLADEERRLADQDGPLVMLLDTNTCGDQEHAH